MTDEEVEVSMVPQLAMTHDEALALGYKDETCSKCGTLFLANAHFIHCAAKPCPMVSTKDTRTLLEMMKGR